MTMNRCDPVARRLTRFAAIVALCVLFPSVGRAEAAITDSTSLRPYAGRRRRGLSSS
jgi:hypothetical protein